MSKLLAALAIGASLLCMPAFAQAPGHGAHHPAPQAPEQAGPTPSADGHRMPGTSGAGAGMGTGMTMNCPMMQRMQGMGMGMGMGMGSGMGAQGHAGPVGDQSVSSIALNAVNEKMHRDMAIAFTGDADVDFARAMIAHHRGAVDMARVVLAFGEDERIRSLATSVISAQEEEIRVMEAWLAERGAK